MMMTELFADGYQEKAAADDLEKFINRCRQFGDRMTTEELTKRGVTISEMICERNKGLIKYDPNCGVTKRKSGYALTSKGIREVFNIMRSR